MREQNDLLQRGDHDIYSTTVTFFSCMTLCPTGLQRMLLAVSAIDTCLSKHVLSTGGGGGCLRRIPPHLHLST